MGEHEDHAGHGHAEKGHPIGALIMVAIIAGLMYWILSIADSPSSAALTLPFTLGFGLYVVFGLARDRSGDH